MYLMEFIHVFNARNLPTVLWFFKHTFVNFLQWESGLGKTHTGKAMLMNASLEGRKGVECVHTHNALESNHKMIYSVMEVRVLLNK